MSVWIRNNILGLVAIFIALSGTAVATGVAGNPAAHTSAKSKRGPAGPPGPQGAAGAQGATGLQGGQGLPGNDGSPDTGAQILGKLAPVDGSGSGLDADRVDGLDSSSLATTGTEAWHELGAAQDGVCSPNGNFCSITSGCQYHNLNANFSSGAYLRDPSGIVHLKGLVQETGSCTPNIIFRLPLGYRPAKSEVVATTSNDAFATIYINPINVGYADVTVQAGAPTAWISMDGISFRCEPSGSNGCP